MYHPIGSGAENLLAVKPPMEGEVVMQGAVHCSLVVVERRSRGSEAERLEGEVR